MKFKLIFVFVLIFSLSSVLAASGNFTMCPSGCNYSSLSGFEAGQQDDLTGTGPANLNISGEWNATAQDTTTVDINGWTTTASDYIYVYTDSSARHDGKWNTTAYRLNVSNTAALSINEDYVRIEGLQVTVINPTASGIAVLDVESQNTNNEIIISYSIFKGHNSSTYWQFMVNLNDADLNLKMYNSIIYGSNDFNNNNNLLRTSSSNELYLYNTLLFGGYYGIRNVAGVSTLKNVLVDNVNSGSGIAQTGGTVNCDYCATSDDTADDFGGTGNRVNQIFQFVDEINGDFHLDASDTNATNQGTDLSSDGNLSFNDDIDGGIRGATWDIGADEFDTTPPQINFTSPTPPNGTSQSNTDVYVNVTITETSDYSAWIDWNKSLLGYWNFDSVLVNGTVYDNSTYNNNGVTSGMALNTTVLGKRGQAMEFDGLNDYIDLGDNGDLTGNFTLSAWINRRGDTNNGFAGTIIGKEINTDQQFNFEFEDAGTLRLITNGLSDVSLRSSSLNDNQWYHVVATYDGSDKVIYVNGVSNATEGATGTMTANSDTLKIGYGRGSGDTANYFNGTIDEVLIFSRALSSQEIGALYDAGSNKLFNNFTELSGGDYTYKATAIDAFGNINSTETRIITISTADTTPPTYSNNQTNNTVAGQSTLFSIQYNDDTALNPNGQYIFSTNNTGVWINDSAINFTATPSWANVSKILNSTAGISIGYRWYANDSVGNNNNTEVFSLTTTSAIDTSFTVTLPSGTLEAIYNASNSTHKNVSAINQTSSIPFFNVTNIGNVNLDFNISINATLPSGIVLKADTDNNPTGATSISISSVLIFTTLTPTTSFGIWYWSDFTNAIEQTISRQLNLTTSQS